MEWLVTEVWSLVQDSWTEVMVASSKETLDWAEDREGWAQAKEDCMEETGWEDFLEVKED